MAQEPHRKQRVPFMVLLTYLCTTALALTLFGGCQTSAGSGGPKAPTTQEGDDHNSNWSTQAGGRADMTSPFHEARSHFRLAIAETYNQEPRRVSVQPTDPDLPNSAFTPLNVGDLFAFRADFPGQDPGPRGFASADGAVAFIAHDKGISALVESCQVLDAEAALPLEESVKRIAWIYRAWGEVIDGHPNFPQIEEPTIERSDDGATITFYTEAPGDTGSINYYRVTVKVANDYSTTVSREQL